MINIDSSIRDIVSSSWQYWHGRETITLTSRTKSSDTAYTIKNCKRFDRTKADIPAQHQGAVVGVDLEWFIPTASLPSSLVPKIYDTITPGDGGEYIIQSCNQNGWKNWWKLQTKNIVVALGLSDTITLLRGNYFNDGGVKTARSYTPLFSVPGKVIETSEEYIEQLLGKRQAKISYEIHTTKFLRWEPGDRIQDAAGNIYQIVSSQAPNVIDLLNVLVCERIS